MPHSAPIPSSRDHLILPPDGRQTRIDFFSNSRPGKQDSHVVSSRRNSFEWWHALTGWIKPGKTGQKKNLGDFEKFLEAKKYTPKTCKSYLFMLRKFFDYLEENQISNVNPGVIEDYNYEFFVSGRYSRSYQLQFINSLTLYLEFSENVRVNLKGLQRSGVRRIR